MTNQAPPGRRTEIVDTPVRGDELLVTDAMLARSAWALRRYSSVSYAERCLAIYKGFVGGVEEYTATLDKDLSFARETLRYLYQFQGLFETGIEELARGRRKRGYDLLQDGCDVIEYIEGRRFEGEYWAVLGWQGRNQPATGVYAWAERALSMGRKLLTTLQAGWTFELLFGLGDADFLAERQFPPVVNLSAYDLRQPPQKAMKITTGSRVPLSGIWTPETVLGGCPNYLVEGRRAPQANRTYLRREYTPGVLADGSPFSGGVYFYEERVDTEWRLLWRDDRYGPNKEPDPPGYLNLETEFPPHPPHYAAPPSGHTPK